MLHFIQKLKTGSCLIVVLVLLGFVNPNGAKAQMVDTIIMHNTGHDATAWWNSICSWTASLNGGSGEFMQCQRWTWASIGCGEGEQIPHIQFSLPAIPTNHVLDKVELELFYPTGNSFPHSIGNNEMFVQRLTDAWDESTLNWINKPNYTTADQASIPAAVSGTQTYTMDITDIAQLWFNGTSNYGVRLKLQNPTTYRRATFASSEHPDSNLHPRIYFTFSPNYSISTTVSDTIVCNGDNAEIKVKTKGMASPTFLWTSIPSGFFSTQSTITVNPTQNTRYIVAVSDTGNTLYDTVDVNIYNCCAIDTTKYKRFHKSFMGLVNEPHGPTLGGRADLTSAGDLLLASYSFVPGTEEALLSKINDNGNYNWSRAYNLPNYEAGLSALELSTGEYLLVGHTNSFGSGKIVLFMQKVDANGTNIIWTRIYDQTLFDVATAYVTELINGDIVVASLASSLTGNGIAVGHFDDNGLVLNYDLKTLSGKGGLTVNAVIATSDGGFLLCGQAESGPANDYNGALLMKYDNGAGLAWAQTYRYPTSSGIYNLGSSNSAEISISKAYSVLENVGAQKFVVVGEASDRFTFNDALIWEVNTMNGNFISARKNNYSGHESSYLGIGQSNTTGDYIMTGYVQDGSTSTELTTFSRCDGLLNFNLHKAYGTPGINPIHRGIDVFEYPGSSDYLIHGRAVESFMPPSSLAQAYAIRTDLNGANSCELTRSPISSTVTLNHFSESENPNISIINVLTTPIPQKDFCGNLVDICSPSLRVFSDDPIVKLASGFQKDNSGFQALSSEEEKGVNLISIMPNPASTYVELEISLPDHETVNLSIINSIGQEVIEMKRMDGIGKHRIDVSSLRAGLYILNLRSNSQLIDQQKLLIAID